MRIAIITENFLPKVDGVTRTLARLLEHISMLGHTAIVFGPESDMETYAGAEIIGTFGIPFFPYPELKCNFWTPRLTSKLVSFQPDIIHLVDPVFFAAFGLGITRYYLPNTPIVSSYHTNLALYCGHFGYGCMTSVMWKWNTYCHSFSSFVACPSPSTQAILMEHGFEQTRLWPRGVDIALFSPLAKSYTLREHWLGTTENKTILLYVGRVSYEKNIHLVIEAYKSMDHRHCHLVLVGHGPAFDDIQTYCATNQIPVTFTGYLQGTDLAHAYASADVFAFPSRTETFGQVVLEAMASGLPVIGLEAEGVSDLVKHNTTGLLLDTTGLTTQEQTIKYRGMLETMVYTPALRQDMSTAAVKEAKRYTWFEAMECMVHMYADAMRKNHTVLPTMPDGEDSGVEEDLDDTLITKKQLNTTSNSSKYQTFI